VLGGAEIVRAAGFGHPAGGLGSLAVSVDRLPAQVARPLPIVGHTVFAPNKSLTHSSPQLSDMAFDKLAFNYIINKTKPLRGFVLLII
jgi:hypothetical protein